MDPVLFEKLPCGGTWWNVQHASRERWEQQSYERNAPKIQMKREAPVREPTKFSGFQQREATPRDEVPVLRKVLEEIDPYFSLYTREQMRDALDLLRGRLLAFVTGLAHPYFGPKKSRTLAAWLSNNKVDKDCGPMIQDFLRFVFEDKASAWEVVAGPRGEWMIKN